MLSRSKSRESNRTGANIPWNSIQNKCYLFSAKFSNAIDLLLSFHNFKIVSSLRWLFGRGLEGATLKTSQELFLQHSIQLGENVLQVRRANSVLAALIVIPCLIYNYANMYQGAVQSQYSSVDKKKKTLHVKGMEGENDLLSWLFRQGVCSFLSEVERTLQPAIVGFGSLLTTWWCYSLTVKLAAFSVKSWKATKIYTPKNPQQPHPWTLETSERLHKKHTILFSFSLFVCDAL